MGDWVVNKPTSPMPIVMSVGPWATSPHARTHAEPNRAGCGWPRPVDTNVVRFRGLLDLLHFCWFFIFYFYLKFCWDFRVELNPFKRIESARCNHSRMITNSLGLLQTERFAEGYKYPIFARIFYRKTDIDLPSFSHRFLTYILLK